MENQLRLGRKQSLEWAENSAFVEQRISCLIQKKMRFGSAVACSVPVLLGELTLCYGGRWGVGVEKGH